MVSSLSAAGKRPLNSAAMQDVIRFEFWMHGLLVPVVALAVVSACDTASFHEQRVEFILFEPAPDRTETVVAP